MGRFKLARSAVVGLAGLVVAATAAGCSGVRGGEEPPADPAPSERASVRHPVTTLLPPNPGTARVEPMLPSGRLSAIPCAQCHEKLKAPAVAPAPDAIEKVHRGMTLAHGSLSCYACHEPTDAYRALRLADGARVAYDDVMTLCSQCHGTQRTDYDHGAHGGMTGYWDLSRGPRERNACTVCHDPHAPAFPKMRPTFKPIDRFLTRTERHPEPDDGH